MTDVAGIIALLLGERGRNPAGTIERFSASGVVAQTEAGHGVNR